MLFNRLRVSTRIQLLGALALLTLIIVETINLYDQHRGLVKERRHSMQHEVETVLSVLDHFHQLETRGTLTS
ncbi:MAG: hypothetical protein LPK85_15335, partial [Gammaproteobacteria bacterium]|nr:hypothetical protein [Gammaproteobacteria bacterium]